MDPDKMLQSKKEEIPVITSPNESWISVVGNSALEPECLALTSSPPSESCATLHQCLHLFIPQPLPLCKMGIWMLHISQDHCEHSSELIQDQSLVNTQEALRSCIIFSWTLSAIFERIVVTLTALMCWVLIWRLLTNGSVWYGLPILQCNSFILESRE